MHPSLLNTPKFSLPMPSTLKRKTPGDSASISTCFCTSYSDLKRKQNSNISSYRVFFCCSERMIEILQRKNLPTSVLQMAEIKFDSYQSWQLLHDTISEENGTQGRDLLSVCIWQSHFPEYNNHPRICSWTKLEIKTPKAWKPFNCYSSISGCAWRPSERGKSPYAQEEGIAS